MKTSIPSFFTIQVVLLFCGILFLNTKTLAQYSERRGPRQYIAVEASAGTNSFTVTSNIPELHRFKVSQEGFQGGLAAGTDAIIGRLRYGVGKSSSVTREKFETRRAELSANIFPLYLMKTKSKLIKPYTLVSLEYSVNKIFGEFTVPKPKPSNIPATPSPTCCQCTCPLAPEIPAEEPRDEAKKDSDGSDLLGQLNVSRMAFGGGVIIHIPMETRFLNLFAEMKYGLPLGVKAGSIELMQTKASNELSMNVGLSFGIRSY